jgi:hypothetical protein
MLELTASIKAMLKEAASALSGAARRRFMARLVEELGQGGQRAAQRELGWDRDTIRKGQQELRTGPRSQTGEPTTGQGRWRRASFRIFVLT